MPPEAIDEAVAELKETGFLDDARYARQFAEDKRELERWGTDRIAMDLRRRGIAPQLIDAATSTHDRDSELRTALLLLEQRYKETPAPECSSLLLAALPPGCWRLGPWHRRVDRPPHDVRAPVRGYLFIDLIKVTIKIAEINISAPAATRPSPSRLSSRA